MTLDSRFKTLPLDASESYDMPISIIGDPSVIKEHSTTVQLEVVSIDDVGKYKVVKENVFTIN